MKNHTKPPAKAMRRRYFRLWRNDDAHLISLVPLLREGDFLKRFIPIRGRGMEINMKHAIFVVLIFILLPFRVFAQDGVKVEIDNKPISFDVHPVISQGRTLVPMRTIFDALGAQVIWDEASQTAIAVKDDITVRITVGSDIIFLNDASVTIDVPAQILSGRTLIPARTVSHALGAEVVWDEETTTVRIKSREQMLRESIIDMLNDIRINE